MNSAAVERGREVRERLLAAAAELIVERGWTAVSTRTLAQRAGVTPSVVHYHFPSVQALLREAAITGMNAAVGELDKFLDSAGGAGDVVEAMLASVASYSGTDPTSMLFIEAYLAGTRDEVLREQIADALRSLRVSLGRRLADRGVADPDATAAVLLAALDGVLLHRALDGGIDGQAAAAILRRLVT